MVHVVPPGWGATSPRVGEALHVVPPGWGAAFPRVGEAWHVSAALHVAFVRELRRGRADAGIVCDTRSAVYACEF